MLPDVEMRREPAAPEATKGGPFIVHDDLRVLLASGSEARRWLHDLVTADVASLVPHQARRTLLLTPTGRIRADLHLLALDDGSFLIAQRADQPEAAAEILAPYRLSSSVELEPVATSLVSVLADVGDVAGARPWRPSILGEDWSDLPTDPSDRARVRARLVETGWAETSPDAVERRRVLMGIPRFGRDFGTDALPAEAGLDALIDREKGCFLGQESVAKVRNLGHPPRVLRHLRSPRAVAVGTTLVAEGRPVGEVTSAITDVEDAGTVMIARVRWEAASLALRTEDDAIPLSVVG